MFLWSLKSLVGRNQYFINQSVTFVCFASLKFELIGTAFSIIFFSTSQLTLFFYVFLKLKLIGKTESILFCHQSFTIFLLCLPEVCIDGEGLIDGEVRLFGHRIALRYEHKQRLLGTTSEIRTKILGWNEKSFISGKFIDLYV